MTDHLVGEGPQLCHPVHVLPTEVVAVRPVADHAAGQREHPEIAEILATRGAPVARPTGGDERDGHVVAHRDLGDVRAHLGHDARSLMTADDGEHGGHADRLEDLGRGADVARTQMLVGVAHARVDHLDPDLPVGRRVDLHFLGLPRLAQP